MQRAKAWKALEVVIEHGQSPESPVPPHGSRLAHPIVPSALGIAMVLERLESNPPSWYSNCDKTAISCLGADATTHIVGGVGRDQPQFAETLRCRDLWCLPAASSSNGFRRLVLCRDGDRYRGPLCLPNAQLPMNRLALRQSSQRQSTRRNSRMRSRRSCSPRPGRAKRAIAARFVQFLPPGGIPQIAGNADISSTAGPQDPMRWTARRMLALLAESHRVPDHRSNYWPCHVAGLRRGTRTAESGPAEQDPGTGTADDAKWTRRQTFKRLPEHNRSRL